MHFPRRVKLPTALLTAAILASGTAPAAESQPPPSLEQPPPLEQRPVVPPLYSAQVAAGLLPAQSPTFVSADRISGKNDVETVAEGNVELRKADKELRTDHLTYWENEDEVEAQGNVRLTTNQDVITGPKLRLKLDDDTGYFEQPRYAIKRQPLGVKGQAPSLTTGTGHASRIDFEGKDHYRLTDATYSTCGPDDPDWYARAGSMNLDYQRQVGAASDATLVFKGVPILYSPWLSFSLNDQRKSGFLSPTFGSTSTSGLEFSLPYFWNIAPNMDMTISPRVMAKRGAQWGGEFRYLEQNYGGQVQAEYLPNDLVTHQTRSSYSFQHNQNFGRGFSGSLNLNGVSDDTYFSDLSTRMANIAQNNLLRQGVLSYGSSWWNASAMVQSFQTLQDPALPPVVVPYHRLPQLTLNAYRADFPLGATFSFSGEYVNFSHPTSVLGQRTTLYPQLALPLQTAAFYLTPKVGVSSTSYVLDRQAAGTPDKLTRTLPIVSVDSGVTLERQTDWFGQHLTQTLEPRLYYLYVPVRDQHLIPVFDTGLADFNFAQIFSDNRYSGGDRIGDANQVTAALTSRLVDPASGAELLRGMIGQRYYFKQQEVTLPGETARTAKTADFLAALSGRILPKSTLDAAWQYNPNENRTERLTLGWRYQPEIGKVLNAGYRYSRDVLVPANQLNQFDVSAQWPIHGAWHGVGRYNYSLQERRIIETVGGLEYNGGCWLSRIVLQRLATATGSSSTAFFVQLELNGFASIGLNPLDTLKRSIPGYGRINQPGADPSVAAD
ncbi:MAG TPA: LPS-assembly protein LptD [Rhodocyclaceae bacterium]|nr:LPS-assembly protein LptD [Rhodocyclaceae bacterium]